MSFGQLLTNLESELSRHSRRKILMRCNCGAQELEDHLEFGMFWRWLHEKGLWQISKFFFKILVFQVFFAQTTQTKVCLMIFPFANNWLRPTTTTTEKSDILLLCLAKMHQMHHHLMDNGP